MEVNSVSDHAVSMYNKRSNTPNRKYKTAVKSILRLSKQGIYLGQNRFYCSGWVLVIVGNIVVTMYKPTKLSTQRLIRNTFIKTNV